MEHSYRLLRLDSHHSTIPPGPLLAFKGLSLDMLLFMFWGWFMSILMLISPSKGDIYWWFLLLHQQIEMLVWAACLRISHIKKYLVSNQIFSLKQGCIGIVKGIGIGFLSCIGIGIGIVKGTFQVLVLVLVLLGASLKYWYWYWYC